MNNHNYDRANGFFPALIIALSAFFLGTFSSALSAESTEVEIWITYFKCHQTTPDDDADGTYLVVEGITCGYPPKPDYSNAARFPAKQIPAKNAKPNRWHMEAGTVRDNILVMKGQLSKNAFWDIVIGIQEDEDKKFNTGYITQGYDDKSTTPQDLMRIAQQTTYRGAADESLGQTKLRVQYTKLAPEVIWGRPQDLASMRAADVTADSATFWAENYGRYEMRVEVRSKAGEDLKKTLPLLKNMTPPKAQVVVIPPPATAEMADPDIDQQPGDKLQPVPGKGDLQVVALHRADQLNGTWVANIGGKNVEYIFSATGEKEFQWTCQALNQVAKGNILSNNRVTASWQTGASMNTAEGSVQFDAQLKPTQINWLNSVVMHRKP